jgi:hypothetical protein
LGKILRVTRIAVVATHYLREAARKIHLVLEDRPFIFFGFLSDFTESSFLFWAAIVPAILKSVVDDDASYANAMRAIVVPKITQ